MNRHFSEPAPFSLQLGRRKLRRDEVKPAYKFVKVAPNVVSIDGKFQTTFDRSAYWKDRPVEVKITPYQKWKADFEEKIARLFKEYLNDPEA